MPGFSRLAAGCAALALAAPGHAVAPPPAPPLAAPPATDCQVARAPGWRIDNLNTPSGVAIFWTDVAVTCAATGAPQSFTLPANADAGSLSVEAAGAAGGDSLVGACCDSRNALYPGGRGLGAVVRSGVPAGPGAALQIRVGGQGKRPDAQPASAGGWNGGGAGGAVPRGAFWGAGGGGATDLRTAPYGDDDRIIVAGGGGGAGGDGPSPRSICSGGGGGGAGGANGGDGRNSCAHVEDASRNNYHSGGYGGTQVRPGAGGDVDRWFDRSVGGGAGAGPAGGTPPQTRFGTEGGGGGGGGLFGGGSGNDTGSGGGGGSSRGAAGTQIQDGARDGDGQLILRYRVTTRRVDCVGNGISAKAMIRGETRPMCRDFR